MVLPSCVAPTGGRRPVCGHCPTSCRWGPSAHTAVCVVAQPEQRLGVAVMVPPHRDGHAYRYWHMVEGFVCEQGSRTKSRRRSRPGPRAITQIHAGSCPKLEAERVHTRPVAARAKSPPLWHALRHACGATIWASSTAGDGAITSATNASGKRIFCCNCPSFVDTAVLYR